MNDAVPVSSDGFLTTAGLAARPDFTLGLAIVSPSTRTIAGPGGTADVEPRVMQVLVVLADAAGQVVTRETLFNRCWGGVYVGDDSLNRAVAAVRKLASDVSGGSFEIETIPRTGYRLSRASPKPVGPVGAGMMGRAYLTRRELSGGTLGFLALGAVGAWGAFNSLDERHFERLLNDGTQALWDDNQFDPGKARRLFEAATRIHPDNPRALGLLALAQSYFAQTAAPKDSLAAVALAGANAQRALAIDPREPNALLAMFQLQGSILDWSQRERRLRQVLAVDAANQGAINELVLLLQAAGYSRESWVWNERGAVLQPLSQNFLGKRALKLWIFGRTGEADKVIDQLRSLFPESQWVWFVRFLILAMTDRPVAAQAMLDANREIRGTPEAALWRSGLNAMLNRSPQSIAEARRACAAGLRVSADLAGEGVMLMSALSEVGSAFDLANGFLLSRGLLVRNPGTLPAGSSDASQRINTQWLFTPPCRVMRADPRFLQLCEGIGLTQYWRSRGVRPDYQLADA